MRVECIGVKAFGRLHGLDTGTEPLGDLVVIRGPNEAGKTTLFHFLATVLYGFAPATREAHPHAPWSGVPPSGSARIRLDDGRCWEVHRRLGSAPAGSLVREGQVEEIKNRPLPCVEHVPPAVFRQVYAITLSELAGLEGEGWARIQERLIVALGAADLRSARAVAEELEREAAQLWRPNRRGHQRIREHRDRLRKLAARRREVTGADQELRDRVRERDRIQSELTEAREEREAAKLYVERSSALLDVCSALERIGALEEEAGPAELLAGVPTEPGRRREELVDRVQAQQTRVDQAAGDADAARRKYASLPPVDTAILEGADDVDRLAARMQGTGWMRARAGQLGQEIRELENQIEIEVSDVFSVPWQRLALDRIRTLPVQELRAQSRVLEEARARLDARREAEHDLHQRVADAYASSGSLRGSRLPGALALAAGLALVVLGMVYDRLVPLIAGTLAVGAGSMLFVSGLRRVTRAVEPAPPAELEPAPVEVDEAVSAFQGLVAGLPLRDGLATRAPSRLAVGLERLQQAILQRQEREAELTGLHEQEAEHHREIVALARECGIQVPDDTLAATHVLASAAAEMRRRQATVERAAEELTRQEARCEREAEVLEQLRTEQSELDEQLADLGGGDPEEGVRHQRTRTEAAAGAARLRQDLAAAHPDLDKLQARIRAAEAEGEDWMVDDQALAKRRARIEELEDRVEALVARSASLDAAIEQLGADETLDRVDGEREVLEEEVRRLERERDRRYVLARLIREADRCVREEYQPTLVRRASEYLATITDGRYTRILLAEESNPAGKDAPFRVRRTDSTEPVPVAAPLSTATREQIYFALRLAAIDHLDREGERLPLFLDETLVNWDPARRDRGIELLSRLAGERQVFVFTTHPEVADLLIGLEASVVSLDSPR